MTRILCTAEPFGYGPSSILAQILPHLDGAELSYIGTAHTLDHHTSLPQYGGRVEECAAEDERFVERCRDADALISVCDFDAARAAEKAGIPFAIFDPLTWFFAEIPDVARRAGLYICQDFFDVRDRLAREGFENAVAVPPITPDVPDVKERDIDLVSFGGLGNPFFSEEKCTEYARAVLGALDEVLKGRGTIQRLTSKSISDAIVGVESVSPSQAHVLQARSKIAFLTPGLGQIYEAATLGVHAVWLPPANDSQGRQLVMIRDSGMAPGAVDWHDFMDVPPVNYWQEQESVMRLLSEYMEKLIGDTTALSALLKTRLENVDALKDNPLRGLIHRFGSGGAAIAGKALSRWIRNPALTQARLAPFQPTEFPKTAPLTTPATNQGGPEDVKTIYKLHLKIDGTGFNTLAAALELAREAKDQGFEKAHEKLHLTGPALFEKYKGGHCTALAEVLRNEVQKETGITGRILTVLYKDSKFPLDYAWKYDGTVHTDVLFPYFENGKFRAVHVVSGMGTDDHFHEFDSMEKLLEHLKDLRYLLAEVVDPAELTAKAFGCKNKLWIKKSKEDRFCVDVVKGETFIANGESQPLKPEKASIDFWGRIAKRYDQPDDFVENLTYLAEHIEDYRELLCEPGRSLR